MSGTGPVALGGFPVVAGRADVAAFRKATGLDGDGATLPLTFPMRWLAAGEIRAAIASAAPDEDVVLVHESQAFEYAIPLRVGEPYTMVLAARRETDPARLIVDGTIQAADGSAHATLETIMRLFPLDAAA